MPHFRLSSENFSSRNLAVVFIFWKPSKYELNSNPVLFLTLLLIEEVKKSGIEILFPPGDSGISPIGLIPIGSPAGEIPLARGGRRPSRPGGTASNRALWLGTGVGAVGPLLC